MIRDTIARILYRIHKKEATLEEIKEMLGPALCTPEPIDLRKHGIV